MRQWLYLVLMRCLNGLNTWVHDRVLLGAVSYKLSFFPFHMTLQDKQNSSLCQVRHLSTFRYLTRRALAARGTLYWTRLQASMTYDCSMRTQRSCNFQCMSKIASRTANRASQSRTSKPGKSLRQIMLYWWIIRCSRISSVTGMKTEDCLYQSS